MYNIFSRTRKYNIRNTKETLGLSWIWYTYRKIYNQVYNKGHLQYIYILRYIYTYTIYNIIYTHKRIYKII